MEMFEIHKETNKNPIKSAVREKRRKSWGRLGKRFALHKFSVIDSTPEHVKFVLIF